MASDDNTLELGRSRIGLMIDGLEETPRVAAKLERTDRGVELTVPLLDGAHDIYQYWFTNRFMVTDDPDRTKRRYEPPTTISFYDAEGSVGLVGSSVAGWRVRLDGAFVGEGRLLFDYAIPGASSGQAYESITGLRSEVEGLGTWIGLRSLKADQVVDDAHRVVTVDLQLQSPPPIRAARRLNLQFRANWRYGPGPGPDQTTITERMQVETHRATPANWHEHLQLHFTVRDLLRVSAWKPLNFVRHEVTSSSDPSRSLDGTVRGKRWLPVITDRTGITSESEPIELLPNAFLFSFDDIGPRGMHRWLQLYRRFERGIGTLVGLLDLEGASLDARVAQVGIGFEMLGYELLLESGASKDSATRTCFKLKAQTVLDTLGDVLPFSTDTFASRLRESYIGVKHADRSRPDDVNAALAYLTAIQVFRAWVASRLGMSDRALDSALKYDVVSRRIVDLQQGSG